MPPEINDYLNEVKSYLHLDPATELQAIKELYSYFQEKIAELEEEGFSREEATKLAIECCGRPRVIARRIYEAHSKGSWREATLALLPHLIVAGLFIFHLWLHFPLAPLAFALIVGVTLYGWWHGKPSWLYPWVGYSLLPLLIGGYASRHALEQAIVYLLWGRGTLPSLWLLMLILALLGFSLWVIISTTIRVVKRDWILASLMLVPLPIVGGWLLNLEQAGGLFAGNPEALHLFDHLMAQALIALGIMAAAFIRLRQRVLKIGALVTIGSVALAMVAHDLWGRLGFLGLLITSLFLLAFLLSPALLEAKVKRVGKAALQANLKSSI